MSGPSVSPHPPTPTSPLDDDNWKPRFKAIFLPTENTESYRPGGYHPVDIGDLMGNGRYKILCKLGFGGFSTVWLARDLTSANHELVAVKVKRARDSQSSSAELSILEQIKTELNSSPAGVNPGYVVPLLDTFQVTGPNGAHTCLVFEAMGPSLAAILETIREYGLPQLPLLRTKSIFKDTLSGMKFLHENGIIHGDIQPGNLLASLRNPEEITDEEIEEIAEDNLFDLERRDGKQDLWAPRFISIPGDEIGKKYANLDTELEIKISDLGTACRESDPNRRKPATPAGLRAPELIVERPFNHTIDIWSVGCLIYELLTTHQLFPCMVFGHTTEQDDDRLLLQFSQTLGPLPQDVFNHWERWQKYYNPDGTLHNNQVSGEPCIRELPDLSLETKFRDYCRKNREEMDGKEIDLALDLLHSIFKYDSAERPSASELLRHAWFEGV